MVTAKRDVHLAARGRVRQGGGVRLTARGAAMPMKHSQAPNTVNKRSKSGALVIFLEVI